MEERFFRAVFRFRWAILAFYVLILVPAVYFATRIETDNSIDKLIVPSDPDKQVFDHFFDVFGSDEFVLIALEGKDIYSGRFLGEVDEIERRLQAVPHLAHSRSLISIFRKGNPLFNPHEEKWQEKFREFALKTPFFNYQGLIAPDRMLTVVLQISIDSPADRREVVKATDRILKQFEEKPGGPIRKIRKVGQPHLNYELDRSSSEIGGRFFPVYLFFAMALVWLLYRSFKGVVVVVITLGVALAMAVATVVVCGSVLTMISGVMPMMVMIVTIETMIHIYSGYVRQPEGVNRREHLIQVLAHKRKACWYSVFTTAVGFGSFVVSPVLPVRDLGVFVASSIIISFVICFTLFPILLDLLAPPTGRKRKNIGFVMFDPILRGIPTYTYWYRMSIVPFLTIIAALGIHSFLGMSVETNSLEYLDEDNDIRKNTIYIENNLIGLLSMEIMLEGEEGQFSNPGMLRRLQDFEEKINILPDVQSLITASTLLRMANFVENGKDDFPGSNFAVSKYILLLSQESVWNNYVSEKFDALRLSAMTKSEGKDIVFKNLDHSFKRLWRDFVKANPEFKNVKMTITGYAPLAHKIGDYLLDTLMSSFSLTLVVVFFVFWLNIRRLTYALIAMLPSLFAIVLMYACMNAAGVKLSITGIIIAACVLGISVDSTIHFFQHYMERLKGGASVEDSLGYSLVITGRAIVVSNFIMFVGFMTFAFSDFPPIKHFGLLTSVAMVFSLFGTLIYLPATLWLMNPKEKPKHIEDESLNPFRVLPPPPSDRS